MRAVTIESWAHFQAESIDRVLKEGTPLQASYMFRGHWNADWSLIPTLARVLAEQHHEM